MKLRNIIPIMAAIGISCAASYSTAAKKPNFVFVISDDHRWDCIGAAGNPNIVTPHIDKLAADGVYFRQGTMHVPQCSPGRAQLLTGLSPHQNGWYSNQYQNFKVRKADGFSHMALFPDLLRKAGYETALVGKWHLNPDPWNCGFKHIRTWLPQGSGKYQDLALANGKSRERKVVPGYTQDVFGDDAVAFIKEQKDKPFFLWLALTAPHSPTKPNPENIRKMYEGKSAEQLVPKTFHGQLGRNPGKWISYYEAITSVDEQVGKIMKTLDDQNLTKNTVVVFLGDNGYMMGMRGVSGKVVPYEDSVRVPFIIHAPGIQKMKGSTEATASSLDLSPTFLKMAGLTPPKQWQGRDLTRVLKDDKKHGITSAISEFPDNENVKFGEMGYRLVRTTRHKLIDWYTKPDELYDIQADPAEAKNLIDDPKLTEIKKKLQRDLEAWKKKTHDDGNTTGARSLAFD